MSLPQNYIDQAIQQGAKVRIFESLEEYLQQSDIANKRYFTRLQLERMGEEILKKEHKLRNSVICSPELFKKLKENKKERKEIKFYHPLPRHKETPTIPSFLDNSSYNAREKQSSNGMYTRIVLLGAIAGVEHIIKDLTRKQTSEDTEKGNKQKNKSRSSYIIDETKRNQMEKTKQKKEYSE